MLSEVSINNIVEALNKVAASTKEGNEIAQKNFELQSKLHESMELQIEQNKDNLKFNKEQLEIAKILNMHHMSEVGIEMAMKAWILAIVHDYHERNNEKVTMEEAAEEVSDLLTFCPELNELLVNVPMEVCDYLTQMKNDMDMRSEIEFEE